LSLVGLVAWRLFPGAQYVRGGYSELFYPPTPGFILFGIGVAMLALWAAGWRAEARLFLPLRWLGKTSLFIYILHYAIIHFWLDRAFPDSSLEKFAVINLVMLAGLILVAWLLGLLARYWKSRPFLVRFLLGG
jgi:fucose 4-O-acetylase-like acetyltransferase